jgi:hypothetical protein
VYRVVTVSHTIVDIVVLHSVSELVEEVNSVVVDVVVSVVVGVVVDVVEGVKVDVLVVEVTSI